jgi:hypothetical protein
MWSTERGANIFGVFRVKNHDCMPLNHIFSNFRALLSDIPFQERSSFHFVVL